MTLQNGLRTPDAAYLWSDTGMYSWDERQLLHHENKIFAGHGLHWAFVHSGTSDVSDEIEGAVCAAMPHTLAALVPCIQSALKPHLGHNWPGPQRVLIAAFEVNRPHLLLISTWQAAAGYPPLSPIPTPHMVSSYSEAIRAEVAKGVTVERMARIIRQQHAESHLDGHWPLSGKVTRARVSREGVELVEVDELPDPMAVANSLQNRSPFVLTG